MKYYKIVVGVTLIGVVYSGQFVTANGKGRLVVADETHGQFVNYKDLLYRDYWMVPVTTNHPFIVANISEISELEYESLKEAVETNEEVEIEDEEDEPIPEVIIEEPDVFVDYVREAKLKAMSTACKNTIETGFDLMLRGETKHFSLTTQDQLNLMNLSIAAQTQQLIPYHADGEEVTFYTAEEINQIISAATSFKNYQLAYHNALKTYINALDSVEAIGAITYGTPIPDEYKSDVLSILE